MTQEAPVLPESADQQAEYTVATSYCTGRLQLEYPVNRWVALKVYLEHVKVAALQEEAKSYDGLPPAHVQRVDVYRRNKNGENELITSTLSDLKGCDCSSMVEEKSE